VRPARIGRIARHCAQLRDLDEERRFSELSFKDRSTSRRVERHDRYGSEFAEISNAPVFQATARYEYLWIGLGTTGSYYSVPIEIPNGSAGNRIIAPHSCEHTGFARRLKDPVRRSIKRPDEPRSPTNCSNFIHEQNDYGRERDPGGQRVASEEVQGHACPAEASSY
jgi:hypothetical protein